MSIRERVLVYAPCPQCGQVATWRGKVAIPGGGTEYTRIDCMNGCPEIEATEDK